jgi:AraC-like DNA-binding protein
MASRTHSFTSRQKMKKNTFEVFHYRDETMQEVALHHHDFYEIYFFISGNVSYNIESRSYRLSPGDILLISPHELHQPIFSPEKQNYERIVLWLNAGFMQQFGVFDQDLRSCFDVQNPEHTNLIRPDGVTRELVNYLVQQLLREQDSEDFAAELYCLSLLTQLLVMVNRSALRAGKEPEARDNADTTVYRILTYINEHYNEELNLDFLANKFFISKYHLSREFGRVVGTSVHRYILQKRLIMARQMMASGRPTSEVYQHCGFGDYSNFYRAFRKEYQISPREYLEELKGEKYAHQRITRLKDLSEQ